MAKKPQKNLDEIGKKILELIVKKLWMMRLNWLKKTLVRVQSCAWVNAQSKKVQVMSSGSLALDIALGSGGYPKGRIIESMGQSHLVRQRLPFMQLRKHKKKVVLLPLSMRNMPLIQLMLRPLVSTLTNCSCPNQTQESKVLRLQEIDWFRCCRSCRGRLSCSPCPSCGNWWRYRW